MRVLRLNEVEQRCGLRKSAIYALIRDGAFPASIKLTPSGQAVGWRSDHLESWIESRPISNPTAAA